LPICTKDAACKNPVEYFSSVKLALKKEAQIKNTFLASFAFAHPHPLLTIWLFGPVSELLALQGQVVLLEGGERLR